MNVNNKLLTGARKIINICLALKKGEKLLIVADTPNREVAEALFQVGNENKCEPVMAIMNPRTSHVEAPPECITKAMASADAAVLATSYSLSHSEARINACRSGTRIISIPGCCNDVFYQGGIKADFVDLAPKVEALGKILANAEKVHISSDTGTGIEVSLTGRKCVNQNCLARTSGSWSPAPLIETAVGPSETGANGIIIVDGVLVPGGKVRYPIRLEVNNGKITSIDGGKQAQELKKALAKYNNTNVFQLVELSLGLNPCARIGKGLMTDDESEFGTMHFGFGTGKTFGISNSSPCHWDVVLKDPILKLDGRLLLANKKYYYGPFS